MTELKDYIVWLILAGIAAYQFGLLIGSIIDLAKDIKKYG